MTKLRKGQKLSGQPLGRCPKCGKGVAAVEAPDGKYGVAHEKPTCEEFDRRNPLAFLTWMREQLSSGRHRRARRVGRR